MRIVQQHSVLHIRLHAVGVELHAEGVVRDALHLAALALLAHQADTAVEDIAAIDVLPTVLHMPLADSRRVVPTVLVHVVVQPVLLAMQQQLGAQMFVQVDVRHRIPFGLQTAVGIQVDVHALFFVGLQILHVNLSGDALEAALHARRPLAHGDAVHPRPRHIVQLIRRRCPCKAGQILYQQLHILAAQTQQLDLAGAHGGIAVVHVHAGIGHKTLAEIATGGTEQNLLPHLLPVLGTAEAAQALGLRLHAHLRERLSLYRVPPLRTGQHRRAQQQTKQNNLFHVFF